MAEQENIVRFKEMAGFILGHLYASHPKPQWWGEEVLEEHAVPVPEIFDDTVKYLIENGYIREPHQGFLRLTDKGFTVLGKPNPLQPDESIGSSLTKWTIETASAVGRDTVVRLAGVALTSLHSAISGV